LTFVSASRQTELNASTTPVRDRIGLATHIEGDSELNTHRAVEQRRDGCDEVPRTLTGRLAELAHRLAGISQAVNCQLPRGAEAFGSRDRVRTLRQQRFGCVQLDHQSAE
jgi:Mg-chelatase subunit ChlI